MESYLRDVSKELFRMSHIYGVISTELYVRSCFYGVVSTESLLLSHFC